MDDDFDSNNIQCSYCGKWLYADAAMCPKCGNYTDGLGPLAKAERPGEKDHRPLPRIYVVAGWLVLIALLIPFAMAILTAWRGR